MGNSINAMGTLGKPNGKFKAGKMMVSFSSSKTHETLSLAFNGFGQITIRYDQVQTVIDKTNDMLKENKLGEKEFVEFGMIGNGLFTREKTNLLLIPSEIHINLRSNGDRSMLSLAYKDKGELSVDFDVVEELIKLTRSNLNET